MATAKKPAAKKPATKSVKKPVPKATIKPKQVKDLSQEEPESKENEMDILKQLLKQSPDRDVPTQRKESPVAKEPVPEVERTETGIKNVYQAYQDPESGVGMNRQERKLPEVPKPAAPAERTLGSILNNIKNREQPAVRRTPLFRK
jgi:hypothetical protein